MWHEDDLPDGDLESVYGPAALHARTLARLDAMLHRSRATTAEAARILTDVRHGSRRLRATPQGLQVLRDTLAQLLASGDCWWSER